MSLRAMRWAWTVPLPRTPKSVLVALAYEADDSGFCFPSHRRLAMQCSMSDRTVRRMLNKIQAAGHMSIEARYRADGSQTSNRYRLAVVDSPDKMTRGVDTHVQGPRTPLARGVDMRVLRTTNYPLSNPPPLPRDAAPSRGESRVEPAAADVRGGRDLEYPTTLSPGQIGALNPLLAELDDESAQQVLDELAGRIKTSRITNPIGYCAALVARLKAREFTPQLGIRVAEERAARLQLQRRESALAHVAETHRESAIRPLPEGLQAALERLRKRAEQTRGKQAPPDEPAGDP